MRVRKAVKVSKAEKAAKAIDDIARIIFKTYANPFYPNNNSAALSTEPPIYTPYKEEISLDDTSYICDTMDDLIACIRCFEYVEITMLIEHIEVAQMKLIYCQMKRGSFDNVTRRFYSKLSCISYIIENMNYFYGDENIKNMNERIRKAEYSAVFISIIDRVKHLPIIEASDSQRPNAELTL